MYFVVLILVLFNINLSHQLTLLCDFKIEDTYYGSYYGCTAKSLTTSFKDRKILGVSGNHQPGKNNDDVKQLYVKFQNVPFLPHNIGEFFPNLEILYIMKSNVQHLIKGDLGGLDNLKIFDVSHNPIELIEKDFFQNSTNLKKISFHDCHLKKIEKGAFDKIKAFELLELNYNDCFSGKYPGYQSIYYYRTPSIREFLANVHDKCTGNGRFLKEQEIIKECKVEEVQDLPVEYGLVFKFGIAMICFLGVMSMFLALITYNFYRKNYKSDWNEVSFNEVSANLNSNGY